ncbi:MAG: pitrilysin family protein [Syntrophorhabdales bacterium]|jgi:zinc protease
MGVRLLKNGLRCIIDRRKGTGVVAVQIWVKVGSASETERTAGISHFIEHLIFKGTDSGEGYEIAPKIEAMGGSINAFTSYDDTVYHIVVPRDALETGLRLLADSVAHPAFPEKELEKEKKVILEEIKMGEDDPQRKLFKELFLASYPGHPYGRPIIGYPVSVSAIGRSDILSYFSEHYRPSRMAVVAVGDFEEKTILDILDGDLSRPEPDGKGAKPEPPRPAGPQDRSRIIEKEVAESYLALSYPIGPFADRDTPALDVLGKVLTDGDSSRLQAVLKHKEGLVTDTDSYVFTPLERGIFVLLATFKGREYERVAEAIEREIGRIAEEGVEPWEVEKAKNIVRASYVYGAESVQGKARQLGTFETLTHDPFYGDEYLSAVERVSGEDLRSVIGAYLRREGRAMVAVLPKEAANPYAFRLDNGLRCVYNRNPASPCFSFMIVFIGGLKEERQGRNGSFNVLARMLLRGTKDLDAPGIARKIDMLAGDISPVSGRNVFGLSGRFLAKDFAQGLSLVKDLVVSTVIRDEEMEKVKEEVLSDIRRRDDDPVPYIFMEMNRLLYDGHSYAKDQIGSADDVTGLTCRDLEELQRDYVVPGGAVIALSGDIEQNQAEDLVRGLFSGWNGGANSLRKVAYSLQSPRERSLAREMYQTHMIFGFLGPGLIDADRYPVEVMRAVLSGMGGRIHKRLREENPYAYAVTFFNQEAYEVGAMGIYIGTDAGRVPDVERIVMAEIDAIRKAGFTEKEVADGKRYMVGNHYITMQTNGSIVSSMCLDTIYGLKPGFFKVWPERVERVPLLEVNEAARKYLVTDRMVKLRVGPAGEGK